LQFTVSGQPNNWIRILAAEGEEVSITPQGEALYGIFIQPTLNQDVRPRYIEIREAEAACIEVSDTSDIVLRDLDVHGCVNGAVELEETERVTLESSNIHDNPLDGNTSAVDLYKCGRDNIVRGNEISGNTDRNHEGEGHGVIMNTCLDQGSALIEDNVIFENQGWCVVIYASDNATVHNNSCKNNGTGSPTSFGQAIGEITTVGSFIDIEGNTMQPRDGSSALDIREDTSIGVKPRIWRSDWSTINISNNIYVAEPQDKIIRIGSSEPVTVSEYKETYAPWGKGDKQTDPQSSD
jgi:parallel beta-helix repeat protein